MKPAAPATHGADLRTVCLLVAALVALAAAFAAFGAAPRSRAAALTAPALPSADARCQAGNVTAAQRAAEATAGADAHMARYPFAPAEGLRALALLAEARDCLLLAGAAAGADRALAQRAASYRERVAADYRDHVTRVRHALAQREAGNDDGELERVRDDVAYLLELLAGRQEPFVAELRGLHSELEAGRRARSKEAGR
jgi:hypothetical protein